MIVEASATSPTSNTAYVAATKGIIFQEAHPLHGAFTPSGLSPCRFIIGIVAFYISRAQLWVTCTRQSTWYACMLGFGLLLLQHQSQLGVYGYPANYQPGVAPYSRLKYQLFLRLPEAQEAQYPF